MEEDLWFCGFNIRSKLRIASELKGIEWIQDAIVLCAMHPWERDSRLLKEALYKGPQYNVLVEIACTRSSDDLLGARKAYHSLFNHSVEEDVAFHLHTPHKKVVIAVLLFYPLSIQFSSNKQSHLCFSFTCSFWLRFWALIDTKAQKWTTKSQKLRPRRFQKRSGQVEAAPWKTTTLSGFYQLGASSTSRLSTSITRKLLVISWIRIVMIPTWFWKKRSNAYAHQKPTSQRWMNQTQFYR